ncbi:MAG TPA: class I SAM-dependent methyltransferase family protein [Solirubrobacteraceae bacterium]|nr:class I SAM-dependent methyltransferase family protein [Solirubrobacteraceae bacterium]
MSAELAARRFEALRADLPWRSPRAWRFTALSLASRAGACLSEGARIGHRHGFDSGPFMAHVYADRAVGRTLLGRLLDRRLLDRATCQAFRDIRRLAEAAVLEAIDAADSDRPVVADLAAGPSPYLLRALAQRPGATAVLCDVDAAALEQALAAAGELGVQDRVITRQASAFERAALAALSPRPDVVCELGLYGIYHDDAIIERHFVDLAERVAPAQIVCNVQVANPEIEYIARVWRNAEGGRCVWRLRPAEQIERYARAAGWEPASVSSDRHGIYRVMRFVRRDRASGAVP